jgi:hypothetical protein
MIKGLTREVKLAIQAKTGLTPGFLVGLAFALLGLLAAFAFFCVAAYVWLERLFGGVFASLIVAGFFLLVAAFGAIFAFAARRRARRRAILERAARAQAKSWLLDPKILATMAEIGRSLGWRQLVPIVLLGFVAGQWMRGSRDGDRGDDKAD